MATLLVIDTSSNICSVVITKAGQQQELIQNQPKTHARIVLSLIDELLARTETDLKEIDAFGVVNGPGSFTGLRIGIGVVQALAFSLNKPVILLSSLELLATESASDESDTGILVALKSKHNEVYFAGYRAAGNGEVQQIEEAKVLNPAEVKVPDNGSDIKKWIGVGDGWQYLADFQDTIGLDSLKMQESLVTSADTLSKVALTKFGKNLTVTAEDALPSYLKEQLDYQTAN